VTEQEHRGGSKMAQAIRSFLSMHDAWDTSDRQIAARIRERVHAEVYRREREHYPEYVDLGGEA
jgi:hypothetical protein